MMGRKGGASHAASASTAMFRPNESVPSPESATNRPNFKNAHRLHDLMEGMVDGAKAEVATILSGGYLCHDDLNRNLKEFESSRTLQRGFWDGARISPTKSLSPPRRLHRLSPDHSVRHRDGGARLSRVLTSAASTSAYGSSIGTTGVSNTHAANTAAPTPSPRNMGDLTTTSPGSSAGGSAPNSRGPSRLDGDRSGSPSRLNTGIERVDYYDSIFASAALGGYEETAPCGLPQVPVFVNSITRTQQYGRLASFDRRIVQRDKAYERTVLSGAKTNRLVELERAMRSELKGCVGSGLDLLRQRLGVYSFYFSEIMTDFPLFAPLLHDIKIEYDMYVNSLRRQTPDIDALRARLADLLADDVRRNMLKIERRRVRTLEGHLTQLKVENEKLQNDLESERNPSTLQSTNISKMASSMSVSRGDVPMKVTEKIALGASKGTSEPSTASSDDHGAGHILTALQSEVDLNVSEYSREIEELHAEITAHIEQIHKLKAEQKEKFVPVSVKNWLEDALAETELEIDRTIKDTHNVRKETEMLRQRLVDVEKTVSAKDVEVSKVLSELEKVRSLGLLCFDFVPDADGSIDHEHVVSMIGDAVNANIPPELSSHVMPRETVEALATAAQQAVVHMQEQIVLQNQTNAQQQSAHLSTHNLSKLSSMSTPGLHKAGSSVSGGGPISKTHSMTGSARDKDGHTRDAHPKEGHGKEGHAKEGHK
eukprot:Opistho-2@75234